MNIKIGTCSWKYDSWRGLVYPESGKLNYLKEYSGQFDTVEIDQWFWSLFSKDAIKLPVANSVNEYNESVGKDFRFTIKVPNSITLTHYYSNRIEGNVKALEINPHFLSIDIFKRFLDSIEPLHLKTGALMLQFEYLNKNKMSSMNEFLDRAGKFFDHIDCEIPMAIEVRNPNYLKREYFRFLKENKIYNVFLQGYYMPDIVPLYMENREHIDDLAIIRLIGPDRKKIEKETGSKWNRVVSPKDQDLRNIADVLKDLEKRGIKVFANINNHYEGSAPLTIKKVKELLRNI